MATNSSQIPERADGNTSAVSQQQRARGAEAVVRPPVDVFEDAGSITLEADMPGVSKDRLEVRMDGETLLVEGQVQFELPEQSEALYADVRSTTYRRSFLLSRELDTGNIQANLRDGVLRVRIPKRAELQPRKIEVLSG